MSATRRPAILFILSAPSGAGKDSLIHLLSPESVGLHRVVSYTTRPPRDGEVAGVDYHFVSEAALRQMEHYGEFLEVTEFIPGRWYGTPRRPVERALAAGLDTLIKPEVLGAAKVRAQFPAAVTIFLAPPSQEEAIRRVVARQSETEADLAARVAVMHREFGAAKDYDYIVINRTGHLEDAVAEVRRIIEIERQRRLPA